VIASRHRSNDFLAFADAAGCSDSSDGFNAALAEMRALELINRGKDIKASEVFFECVVNMKSASSTQYLVFRPTKCR
jgi:hypothetical protein